MAVIAFAGWPLASIGVEIVHVAHLDLLDALQRFQLIVERRIDALSLLVVALRGLLDRTRDGAGQR